MHKSMRQSNFELLRIICMLGVLMLHADFMALGSPTQNELLECTLYCVVRTFIESFTVVASNVFILISGWWGINFRVKSIGNLFFQVFYFTFGIYTVMVLLGILPFEYVYIYSCLILKDNAWFVKCYIGLMILAPALNAMFKVMEEKQIKILLICFFTFQTLFGWLFPTSVSFIQAGYSTFSFMGLYLLGRYVKEYKPFWSKWRPSSDIFVYGVLASVLALGILVSIYIGSSSGPCILLNYTNPILIIASLYLLLAFSKISIYSKTINYVAESCFAVFMFQFILFEKYMIPWILHINENYQGIIMLLLITSSLCLFYIAAIIIDKPRIFMWKKIMVISQDNKGQQ